VEAAGIESETSVSQSVADQELTKPDGEVSALCLHGERTSCQCLAAMDSELMRVVELWPSLPEPTRRTIYDLCIDGALFDL
jgi:hypothetical protein